VTHDDARLYASARADGEAAPDAALDEHLASCADCAAYAEGLARLSTLAAALPREAAPASFGRRVQRRRRLPRWAAAGAAVAAATAVLVVGTLPAGLPTFPPPDAAAAEPLRTLRSLYVERTVTGPEGEAYERIWWRAPASVRVERTEHGATVTRIETPVLSYDGTTATHDPAPSIPLPEPLSVTAALLGRDLGPGPVVAGRTTRRVELTVGGGRRVAYVDTERALALGGDETLVLGKASGSVTKRVTRVDRDPGVPDALFQAPDGAPAADGGFRTRDLGDLSIEPERLPRGFATVRAGAGPAGESLLLADGSLPLLVTTRPVDHAGEVTVRAVGRGPRTYLVTLALYDPPMVEFLRDGVSLKVSAPLPVDSLLDLADAMYPVE
jgi:hypothetical protein